MPEVPEFIRYWHEPVLGGLDLLSASCVDHRFARHAHEEFVLAAFDRGAEAFEAGSQTLVATAGSIVLLPPGISHTGRAAHPDGWSYRAFYPRQSLVRDVCDALYRGRTNVDRIPVSVCADARLAAALIRVHRFLSTDEPELDKAAELVGALKSMLRHVLPGAVAKAPGAEHRAIAIARDFIHARYRDPIAGADIAAAAGLSLPHLMRAFSARMGVPINVYLTTVRLAHARVLLRKGDAPAGVATDVGFVDQSHLIRRFREAFGVTPGQYVRDSTRRQV